MATDYAGIDYGRGKANVADNGIRYGVIPQNDVLQAWADSSEADYGSPDESCPCPECGHDDGVIPADWGDPLQCSECGAEYDCELPDCAEPLAWILDDGEYKAQGGEVDIFVLKSPYFTFAQFCSPCAPGACYLRNPFSLGSAKLDQNALKAPHPQHFNTYANWALMSGFERCYCFGEDWFDAEYSPCPYPIFSVETGELVYTPPQTEES